MRFSKDWPKLDGEYFTTIRKNTGTYKLGRTYTIVTPTQRFRAKIQVAEEITKEGLTEGLAREDADCSRAELIAMLEGWYGKKFNNFILLGLRKEVE